MKTFLALVLLLVSVPAFAGVSWDGVCYNDMDEAVKGIRALFPRIRDGKFEDMTVEAWATNTISVVYFIGDMVTDQMIAQTYENFYLEPCTPNGVFGAYPVQDVLFAAVLTIAAILGFISGRMR